MIFQQLLAYYDEKDIFNSLLGAFILFVFSKGFKVAKGQLPKIRNFRKWLRIRSLKKVRKHRHDSRYFIYQISKQDSLFLIFVVVGIVNFLLVFRWVGDTWYAILLLMIPTFISEFKWLMQKSYVEDLIKYQPRNTTINH